MKISFDPSQRNLKQGDFLDFFSLRHRQSDALTTRQDLNHLSSTLQYKKIFVLFLLA
jgi:hypothetical protein